MAEKKDEEQKKEEQAPKEKVYDKAIKKLLREREELLKELDHDYKEARRYVRSHPEEGVLIGFLGGVAVGLILGKLLK